MTSSSTAPPRRARILLIDDEPDLLRAMRRLLGSDHEVDVALGARAGLERIEAGESYDLVLCDLMMPEMTGMDFHAALAARDDRLAGRVVFVTGGAFSSAARAFLDSVPNACLEKPFEPPQLGR